MGLLLDLIVIGIVVLFAAISAKHGFVRTVIEVVGFFLIMLLATKISVPLANTTYDKFIEPPIMKSIETLPDESLGDIEIPDNFASNMLPEFVQKYVDDKGVLEDFEKSITENINNGVQAAVLSASQTVIKPVISNVLSMVYSLLITTVLMFVVNILAKVVNKFFTFSIIGKVNTILGAVFGAVKGIIVAVIFCTFISLIVSFLQDGFLIFTDSAISSSFIFKLCCLKL